MINRVNLNFINNLKQLPNFRPSFCNLNPMISSFSLFLNKKAFFASVLISGLFLSSSLVYAQVSADPSDPSAVGFSKTKKAAIRQSPYTYVITSSVQRGLDYYSDIFLNHSFALIYKGKNNDFFSASTSYSHPSSGVATFPEDWGFEDLALSYTKNNIFQITKDSRTTLRVGVSLPTSNTSQRATLLGRVSGSLPTSFQFYGNNVVINTGISLSHFRYDVADFGGNQQNRPLAIPLSLIVSRALYKNFFATINAGVTQLADYDFNFIQVNSAGLTLTSQLSAKLSVSGGYVWSDLRLSNNSLFDDDRSFYFLSLSFVM